MHQRTEQINAAIRAAKERDKHRCRKCNQGRANGAILDGAHLVSGRNSAFGDPRDADGIITLCRVCHRQFDANAGVVERLVWLERWIGRKEADYLRRQYGEAV